MADDPKLARKCWLNAAKRHTMRAYGKGDPPCTPYDECPVCTSPREGCWDCRVLTACEEYQTWNDNFEGSLYVLSLKDVETYELMKAAFCMEKYLGLI